MVPSRSTMAASKGPASFKRVINVPYIVPFGRSMSPFADSPIPRYAQLSDVMRQRIARGTWQRGHRLPPLPDLMAEFGVARVTVRQAVDLLAREGLLSPQQG